MLIIGLGNPGEKYKNNRHNAGFMLMEYLLKTASATSNWKESKYGQLAYAWINMSREKVEIIKPQTFMNRSGISVSYALKKHRLTSTDLIVVHDDLDIPLGKFKIQLGSGPQLHNGISSIEQQLGTKEFWRVRIGVDNRPPAGGPKRRLDGETYVLSDFTSEEQKELSKTFPEILSRLILLQKQNTQSR